MLFYLVYITAVWSRSSKSCRDVCCTVVKVTLHYKGSPKDRLMSCFAFSDGGRLDTKISSENLKIE